MSHSYKLLLVFLFLNLTLCALMSPRVGGFTVQNSIPKDDEFKAIDDFVKKQMTELAEAIILSVSIQIVSGTNYKIVYQKTNGEQIEVVVYNQPWTKTTRILRSAKLL